MDSGRSVRPFLLVLLVALPPRAHALAAPATIFAAPVVTFREGTSGYAGTVDTELREANPGTPQNGAASITVDGDEPPGSGLDAQGLLRFDGIFGTGSNRIPWGSTIASATLTLRVVNASVAGAQIGLHRMLVNWPATATWSSLVAGVQANGVEARVAADALVASPASTGSQTIAGLAPALQAWSNGSTSAGWVFLTNHTDGWDFATANHATSAWRPLLTVDYTAPPLVIVKRAFELDGTAVPTGAPAPRGAFLRFLIYVNNARTAVSDVSLEDVLDPGFEYVPGTMTVDASAAACADTVCTGAEEATIYAAAVAGGAGTDAVDGDEVSYAASRISVGNESVPNAGLGIPADRVWGLVFTVRVR